VLLFEIFCVAFRDITMSYCSQVYRGFKTIEHLSGTSFMRGVLLVDAWHVLRDVAKKRGFEFCVDDYLRL